MATQGTVQGSLSWFDSRPGLQFLGFLRPINALSDFKKTIDTTPIGPNLFGLPLDRYCAGEASGLPFSTT